MKFKGIEVTGEFTMKHNNKFFTIHKNDILIYVEYLDGYWKIWEYDNNGKLKYFEDDYGYIIDKRIDALIDKEQIIKIKEN